MGFVARFTPSPMFTISRDDANTMHALRVLMDGGLLKVSEYEGNVIDIWMSSRQIVIDDGMRCDACGARARWCYIDTYDLDVPHITPATGEDDVPLGYLCDECASHAHSDEAIYNLEPLEGLVYDPDVSIVVDSVTRNA